jgi:serine phosphatase RsbU (regulator of sigma subunit)
MIDNLESGIILIIALITISLAVAVYLIIIWMKLRSLKIKSEEILNSVSKDIIDSINYAKALQEATFPDAARLKQFFEDVFIVLKPMETVSGDFHWFGNVSGRIYLAVVDCQGHGVPGAFLSMIGNTLLSQIIIEENTRMPDKILNKMNIKLSGILSNISITEKERDLMSLGICMIDYDEGKIYYSGAKHSLYYINDGRFREIEGSSHPVGMIGKNEVSRFALHEIEITGSLNLYMTSEGFNYETASADSQVASLQMINLILKIGSLPFSEQFEAINAELDNYDYRSIQTDDFTIIGLQVR